mgnify:CR=1 FL=1
MEIRSSGQGQSGHDLKGVCPLGNNMQPAVSEVFTNPAEANLAANPWFKAAGYGIPISIVFWIIGDEDGFFASMGSLTCCFSLVAFLIGGSKAQSELAKKGLNNAGVSLQQFTQQSPISSGNDVVSLTIEKSNWQDGEEIALRFTAPPWPAEAMAWVGIVPADTESGSEEINDAAAVSYLHLGGHQSGRLTFPSPGEGPWSIRLHSADDPTMGEQLAEVDFTVGLHPQQPIIDLIKDKVDTSKWDGIVEEIAEKAENGDFGENLDNEEIRNISRSLLSTKTSGMPEPVQAAAQSALEKKLDKALKSIDAKKAGIVAASATGLAGIGMAAASVSASAERVKQVAEVIEEAVEEPEPPAPEEYPKELVMLSEYLSNSEQSIHQFFKSIDLDGSGKIDAYELQMALKETGIADLPPWETSSLLAAIDTDKDGQIDLPELEIAIAKISKETSPKESDSELETEAIGQESEAIEQESEPELEPEPEVIQEEVQVVEEASISLHDLVHQLGEARFASERSAIMDSIDGGAYNFSIEVSGVERTLGIGLDEYLRGGRSLAGNVVGDDIEVLIRMPSSRNEEMESIKGSVIELTATASDWNNLRKRLDMNHIE